MRKSKGLVKIITILLVFILVKPSFAQNTALSVGDTFPNFEFNGLLNKPTNLYSLRGSYTLITFWASWNNESRMFNRDILPIYSKYREKKFETGRRFNVVSVSIDKNKNYYQLALKKDNPAWYYYYNDFMGWKSKLIGELDIQRIPFNVLVDPNGAVLKKNVSPKELELLLKAL